MSVFNDRKKGLVSVIISTYNYGKFISETLEGLKGQSYSLIEVIIVDDCSTDNTEGVIKNWGKQNAEVFADFQYIKLPRNVFQEWALNIGFCISKGEYIVIHDADDISHQKKIEKQVKWLKEHQETSAVGTKYKNFIGNKDQIISYSHWIKTDRKEIERFYKETLYHCVCFGTIMFRAEILNKIIGLKKYPDRHNDRLFVRDIVINDYILDNIDEYLFYVRKHPEQNSKKINDDLKNHGKKTYKSYEILDDRVSVILPVKKKSKCIISTLNSIAEQTYKDIELIIIDDSSQDNTEEIIKDWYAKYNKEIKELIYFNLPLRVGYPWVYNIGAYLSRGEYLVFHSDKGFSLNKKIQNQLAFLKNNYSYSVIGTNYNGDQPAIKYGNDIEDSYMIKKESAININTIMFRSNVINGTSGLNKSIVGREDFEFISRIIKNGYRVQNLEEQLYYEN